MAAIPLISACAERAGKNVLNTPMGRLFVPGAIVSTNGAMQSYHVSRIFSLAEVTVSHAAARGSPPRANSAEMIGRLSSAKAGKSKVSMLRWSHRATAALSL